MRYLVLTDIHANLEALDACLADARLRTYDHTLILGDLVGYGAEPDACIELARERCDLCLVGNHDLAVRGDISLSEFSRGAELAARWTQETIGEDNLEFLLGLEPDTQFL